MLAEALGGLTRLTPAQGSGGDEPGAVVMDIWKLPAEAGANARTLCAPFLIDPAAPTTTCAALPQGQMPA